VVNLSKDKMFWLGWLLLIGLWVVAMKLLIWLDAGNAWAMGIVYTGFGGLCGLIYLTGE